MSFRPAKENKPDFPAGREPRMSKDEREKRALREDARAPRERPLSARPSAYKTLRGNLREDS